MTRREALIVGGVAVAAGGGAAALLATNFADLDGKPRRLLDRQGRALLCNFWASWCAPCREEIPLLVAAKQHGVPSRAEIVGIGIDSADKIRDFAKTYKINYPVLVADVGAIAPHGCADLAPSWGL